MTQDEHNNTCSYKDQHRKQCENSILDEMHLDQRQQAIVITIAVIQYSPEVQTSPDTVVGSCTVTPKQRNPCNDIQTVINGLQLKMLGVSTMLNPVTPCGVLKMPDILSCQTGEPS